MRHRIRTPTTMGDSEDSRKKSVKLFCHYTRESQDVARKYLTDHDWDCFDAMEAYHSDKSPPVVPDPIPISTLPPNEQQPPSSNNELIERFRGFFPEATLIEATKYLERSNWDPNLAAQQWMGRFESSPSRFHGSGSSSSGLMDVDMRDAALAMTTMADVSPHIRPSSGLPSSGLQGVEIRDAGEGNIPGMRSSGVNNRNVRGRGQIWKETWPDMKVWLDTIREICNVSRGEALFRLEQSKWDWDVALDACLNKGRSPDRTTSLPGPMVIDPPEQHSQLENELISFFCGATGVTREVAINYLESCKWNADQAYDCFKNVNSIPEEGTSRGVPSQSQIQASHGRSSSSIDADPTEVGSSHKEAGEERVFVATPGLASSQVDGDDAAEEDSETKTIKIELANGDPISIRCKLDETVRDIHTRIDRKVTAVDKRDYYLMSIDEMFEDMNITVKAIVRRQGETHLVQVYYDNNNN